MTIDEAIKQEKEFALKCRKSVEIAICENKKYDSDNIGSLRIYETIQENKDTIEMYTRKAEYHEQLAEWLEELKANKVTSAETYESGYKRGYRDSYTKALDDVMAKAREIQEEQIKNLEQYPKRYGKQWAMYMNTHLGHIQVACKRLIAEQLKEGSADNE